MRMFFSTKGLNINAVTIKTDWYMITLSFQVHDWLLNLIGMNDPKKEAAASRKKYMYDFKKEVLEWRIKLRRERSVCVPYTFRVYVLV